MALFFDAAWFDERMARLGLSRTTLATALGLTDEQIAELWKDQRELSVDDVRLIANLLNESGAEIASRAGISTPVPEPPQPSLREIAERLERLERAVADLIRNGRGVA